ncbi:MAG: hypothetical protein H6622_14420 [Halobacteriovoraceae bacterium]|nr:hypothetical protein [Halobacteriovoraceae bacterium]
MNKNGLSLVELIIAAAILSGLALVGGNIITSSMKGIKTVEIRSDELSYLSEIRDIISDRDTCISNFQGLSAYTGTLLEIKNKEGLAVFKTGVDLNNNGHQIKSFELNHSDPLLTDDTTHLFVYFTRGHSTVGVKESVKKIKLSVILDGNQEITSCRALSIEGAGGSSLWSLSSNSPQGQDNIFYNSGNVGIGLEDPKVSLDIAGSIKLSMSTVECKPETEGTIRYDARSKKLQYCNSTSWANIAQELITEEKFYDVNPNLYGVTLVEETRQHRSGSGEPWESIGTGIYQFRGRNLTVSHLVNLYSLFPNLKSAMETDPSSLVYIELVNMGVGLFPDFTEKFSDANNLPLTPTDTNIDPPNCQMRLNVKMIYPNLTAETKDGRDKYWMAKMTFDPRTGFMEIFGIAGGGWGECAGNECTGCLDNLTIRVRYAPI